MSEAQFWERFGGTEMVERFATLEQLAAASDLVVLGTVIDVAEGRSIKVPETSETMLMAELHLTVDEVLAGSVTSPAGRPDTVVVETLRGFNRDPATLETIVSGAPDNQQVILFLVNKTKDALRHGFPADAPYAGDSYYGLLNGTQAVIRNSAQTAAAGSEEADGDWVRAFDGRPFSTVVDDLRQVLK